MNVLENLGQSLAELLRADPRRVVLGEDVADGTMLGLTRAAMNDPELKDRLVGRPLGPTTLTAHAAGMAAAGMRPVVILPSAGALLEGLAGLREAAQIGWNSAGERTAPVLFIAPSGPGFGLGGESTEGVEATLCGLAGLRVIALSDPESSGAMLRAAADFWAGEEPTVLLIPRTLALRPAPADDGAELGRPFACPRRVREGAAATVFAWGPCVELATLAATSSGVDARVVDVECLSPLPAAALVDEAKATGKLVIVHGGPRHHGIGAELSALFADEAILHLDAPVVRVTGAEAPLRFGAESAALPSVSDIADAIARVAHY